MNIQPHFSRSGAESIFRKKQMRESGVKAHVRTKIVTLKVALWEGEHVKPRSHWA